MGNGGGSRPGSSGGGSTGSYLASTEVLNKALTRKCQELAHEQKLRQEADAKVSELSVQLAQLRAQVAALAQQREADRAEIAGLKQQLAQGGRTNGRH